MPVPYRQDDESYAQQQRRPGTTARLHRVQQRLGETRRTADLATRRLLHTGGFGHRHSRHERHRQNHDDENGARPPPTRRGHRARARTPGRRDEPPDRVRAAKLHFGHRLQSHRRAVGAARPDRHPFRRPLRHQGATREGEGGHDLHRHRRQGPLPAVRAFGRSAPARRHRAGLGMRPETAHARRAARESRPGQPARRGACAGTAQQGARHDDPGRRTRSQYAAADPDRRRLSAGRASSLRGDERRAGFQAAHAPVRHQSAGRHHAAGGHVRHPHPDEADDVVPDTHDTSEVAQFHHHEYHERKGRAQ